MNAAPTEPLKPWQRRASPLARYALLVYVLLVIHASLYPFAGWRDMGIAPFDFLHGPWPRLYFAFDLTANVLGYVPLGFLAVLACYPRLRGALAVLCAALAAAALSCGLEALQNYLPARVSSLLDLSTNALGGLIGALAGAWLVQPILDRGRLRDWRQRWFEHAASPGLVLTALWFGVLIHAEQFALAGGGVVKPFEGKLQEWLGIEHARQLTPEEFMVAEAWASGLTVLAAGLLFLNLMRPFAPRLRLLAVFIATTVAVKTLIAGIVATHPLAWLTPGARWGLAAATIMLACSGKLSSLSRARLGMVALLVALLLVNVLPDNPYFDTVSRPWASGRFLNFFGLAHGLSMAWPFLAFWQLATWRPGAALRL